MITASLMRDALATRLSRRARLLAQARAESLYRARHHDAGRWRHPRLLWPVFAEGE